MQTSTIVLILTGVFFIIVFITILVSFLLTDNNKYVPVTVTGILEPPVPLVCNVEGIKQNLEPLPYERKIPYSNGIPYSLSNSTFLNVDHPVPQLTRIRSSGIKQSTNHWVSSSFFGIDNLFLCYPYHVSISDENFKFSWPNQGQLETINITGSSGTGNQELIFQCPFDNYLTIGARGQNFGANDMVNVDALTTNVDWQYLNPGNAKSSAFRAIFCQGCPYITIQNFSALITIEGTTGTQLTKTSYGYSLSLGYDNYAIFLPSNIEINQFGNIYQTPPFEGFIRFAHYQDSSELSLIIANSGYYISECQVSCDVDTSQPTWQSKYQYNFYSLTGSTGSNLMAILPHHNLVNQSTSSSNYPHPLLGPYRLVTTNNNNLSMIDTLPSLSFQYPLPSSGMTALAKVYSNDVKNILNYMIPSEPMDWMRWMGSLAQLVIIGQSIGVDTTGILSVLTNQISRIDHYNGLLTNKIAFLQDKRWGGVITSLNSDNCSGTGSEGNAFYRSHIGHHGYLLLAYAVSFLYKNDPQFISNHQNSALQLARSLLNVSTQDTSYPLWRNKHWYLGWSLDTGIEPSITKTTGNIGEIINGYYAGYLLGQSLQNSELSKWSLTMLAIETQTQKINFQVSSDNSISLNPAFVQGTVTERNDTFYSYYYQGGTNSFPQKNASMTIPILKPLNQIGLSSIDNNWAQTFSPFVNSGLTGNVDFETYAYSQAIIANPSNLTTIIDNIVSNSINPLPYGSLWSSILYYILLK